MRQKTTGFGLAAVAFGLTIMSSGEAPGKQAKAPTVRIGVVSSMFRGIPAMKAQAAIPEFQSLMREQTGLEGEVIAVADADDLCKKLNDNLVQFGDFHGFEFAWAQQRCANLQPVVIAINRHRYLKAFVAVREDNKAADLADLRGKTISIPKDSHEHCLLFLDRELKSHGAEQKEFFGKIVPHDSIEDALDDILRDKVQAALVDGLRLKTYDQVKPGCFARLKIVAQSANFPPDVAVFRKGAVDDAIVAKVKTGMLAANSTVRGKEQMAFWKLTAFENLPADFEATVGNILKIYPPPRDK